MDLLCKYHWPGNIRELQNVIERSTIICRDQEIRPEHLPRDIYTTPKSTGEMIVEFPEQGLSLEDLEKELILKALEKSGGNQTKAAQLLGITRSALLYRSQKHNIF